MRKPSLSEIKEHFKNAKIVECAYTKNEVDISINVQREPYPLHDEYWIDLQKNHYKQVEFNLWDEDTGYAKIISYKDEKNEFIISQAQLEELKYLLSDDSHSGHHLRIEITKNILPELFKEEIQTITKEEAEKQLGKKIID